MQAKLSVIYLSLFASSVSARPSLHLKRDTCQALPCIEDLAPTISSCASALVEAGTNVLTDIDCVEAIVKDITNLPTSCAGCVADLESGGSSIIAAIKGQHPATSVKASPTGGSGAVVTTIASSPTVTLAPSPSGTCQALQCVEDLGPSISSCASALVAAGADIVTDVDCVGGIIGDITSLPASCSGCVDDIKKGGSSIISAIKGHHSSTVAVVTPLPSTVRATDTDTDCTTTTLPQAAVTTKPVNAANGTLSLPSNATLPGNVTAGAAAASPRRVFGLSVFTAFLMTLL